MNQNPYQDEQQMPQYMSDISQLQHPVNNESIRFQLEVEEIKKDLQYQLEGKSKQWDDKKADYIYLKNREPLINKVGIDKVMLMVNPVLDKNTILSVYTEEQIVNTIIRVTGDLIDSLAMNYHDWQINRRDMNIIVNLVENTIRSTLLRALDGKTLESLRDREKMVETHTIDNQRQQGGIISRIAGKLRMGG